MVRKSTRLPQSSQSIQDSKCIRPVKRCVGSTPTFSARTPSSQEVSAFCELFYLTKIAGSDMKPIINIDDEDILRQSSLTALSQESNYFLLLFGPVL